MTQSWAHGPVCSSECAAVCRTRKGHKITSRHKEKSRKNLFGESQECKESFPNLFHSNRSHMAKQQYHPVLKGSIKKWLGENCVFKTQEDKLLLLAFRDLPSSFIHWCSFKGVNSAWESIALKGNNYVISEQIIVQIQDYQSANMVQSKCLNHTQTKKNLWFCRTSNFLFILKKWLQGMNICPSSVRMILTQLQVRTLWWGAPEWMSDHATNDYNKKYTSF